MERIPTEQWQLLEQVCRRFEAAWKGNVPPRILDFLKEVPEADRVFLIRELLAIDLEIRAKQKLPIPVPYRELLPEYAVLVDELVGPTNTEKQSTVSWLPPVAVPQRAHPLAARADLPSIRHYEMLDELGRGGMGVVFRARDLRFNRLVAIKMIRAGAYAGSDELARFRLEAEAVARLQHANIVQIHEIGEHAGLPYFSLEYCAGGSLATKLAGTPLPSQDAAELVETLTWAVAAAHQKNVIHRDLKPHNVLLADNGTPKITDFGLAKKLEASQDVANRIHLAKHRKVGEDEAVGLTRSGVIMGTPSYMAPEQASGKTKEIGPATDVYALGAILYECLTGRPPFKAATATDTILQVLRDEPALPTRLNPKVARDLETICLKCLHKESGRRYLSAGELAGDLSRFRAGEPIHARPVSKLERLWRWSRRKPALAATGFVATTALLIAIGLTVVMAFSEAENAQRAADDAWTISLKQQETARALEDVKRQEKHTAAALEDVKHQEKLTAKALNEAKHQERLTAKALKEAKRQEKLTAMALEESKRQEKQAKRRTAELLFEQAYARCLQEDSHRGLIWLALVLNEVGKLDAPDIERAIRRHLDAWRWHVHRIRSKHAVGCVTLDSGVVAFSPNGKTILMSWDCYGTGLVETVKKVGRDVRCIAFSADGKMFLTGDSLNKARLWNSATDSELGPPLPHQASVGAGAFSPDGKTVLTASNNDTLQFWETATGKPLRLFQHRGMVDSVDFSPNGKLVLTGRRFFNIGWLWETATGKGLGVSTQHKNFVKVVAFSPDGKAFVTGNADEFAKLWEATTGKLLATLPHQVTAATFSPDSKTILTGGKDKTALLWEAASGKSLATLQHQGSVTAVAFSPDSKVVLTGSSDRTARLWETATGKPLALLQHKSGIEAVAFSSDSETVVTASGDIARLWEPATGKALGPTFQEFGEQITSVIFSPGGKTVLARSSHGFTRLWPVPTPMPGDPERILLWAEVITGMEVVQGVVHALDGGTLAERRRRLERLGGPPVP